MMPIDIVTRLERRCRCTPDNDAEGVFVLDDAACEINRLRDIVSAGDTFKYNSDLYHAMCSKLWQVVKSDGTSDCASIAAAEIERLRREVETLRATLTGKDAERDQCISAMEKEFDTEAECAGLRIIREVLPDTAGLTDGVACRRFAAPIGYILDDNGVVQKVEELDTLRADRRVLAEEVEAWRSYDTLSSASWCTQNDEQAAWAEKKRAVSATDASGAMGRGSA